MNLPYVLVSADEDLHLAMPGAGIAALTLCGQGVRRALTDREAVTEHRTHLCSRCSVYEPKALAKLGQ